MKPRNPEEYEIMLAKQIADKIDYEVFWQVIREMWIERYFLKWRSGR